MSAAHGSDWIEIRYKPHAATYRVRWDDVRPDGSVVGLEIQNRISRDGLEWIDVVDFEPLDFFQMGLMAAKTETDPR